VHIGGSLRLHGIREARLAGGNGVGAPGNPRRSAFNDALVNPPDHGGCQSGSSLRPASASSMRVSLPSFTFKLKT
jgi:hypothetical protein